MQVVIERAGLHSEGLAAHQACRRVGDSRRVIPACAIAQSSGEASQLRGDTVSALARYSITRDLNPSILSTGSEQLKGICNTKAVNL